MDLHNDYWEEDDDDDNGDDDFGCGDSCMICVALHCTMQLASGLVSLPYQSQGGNALALLSL